MTFLAFAVIWLLLAALMLAFLFVMDMKAELRHAKELNRRLLPENGITIGEGGIHVAYETTPQEARAIHATTKTLLRIKAELDCSEAPEGMITTTEAQLERRRN